MTCHLIEEVFLDAEGRIRCLCVAVIPISLPLQFYTPSKLLVCVYLVLATKLGGLTQQSFILVMNLQFGQGPVRTACPCSTQSRVSWGSSPGAGARFRHGPFLEVTVGAGWQALSARVFPWGSSSGIFTAWRLGSKSEGPKRQEVETASFLRPPPRNR